MLWQPSTRFHLTLLTRTFLIHLNILFELPFLSSDLRFSSPVKINCIKDLIAINLGRVNLSAFPMSSQHTKAYSVKLKRNMLSM